MIEITFKFTASELYKASVAIARSRFIMGVYRVIGISSITAALVILYNNIVTGDHVILPFIAIIFIVSGSYLTFVAEIASNLVAKKYIKTKAQITEQVTYRFDEKSYQLTGASFLTRMDYNKLNEVKEVSDFILLRVTDYSAHTVPKRAFSADQFADFKTIIRAVPNLQSTFKE